MAKKEKVTDNPTAPPEVIEAGDPMPSVRTLPIVGEVIDPATMHTETTEIVHPAPKDDEPDDDFDDPKPGPKRNIIYVGKGEAPHEFSLNGAPDFKLRHDTERQRAGFYHRYAALMISDARDPRTGKRIYKVFREDKGKKET
jgi:hypothetical protein